MSGQPEGLKITEQDVEAVTERFKSWVTTLPEEEQRVFGWILTRAAAAKDEDAARYGMDVGADVPVSKLMADAVGAGQAPASDVAGFALPDKIGPVTVWTFRW
jgi:hypothetical protein